MKTPLNWLKEYVDIGCTPREFAEVLTYTGTKDGESVELHFSLQKIYRLLFGAGVNFEIYNGSEILFFVPEEKRAAVQWYMASMILHDTAPKP